MKRTFVLGDIHGGLRALVQVLSRAAVRPDDTLIFLGDYVDGWSESPEVLDFLIELSQKQLCFFMRGNHDELLLDWLEHRKENFNEAMWFKHGGKATAEAYLKVSELKKQQHVEFLKSLRNYYLDDGNRLFVHAGFTNLNGVSMEYFPKLLYWDRTLWEMALCMDDRIEKIASTYPKRLKLYHEIYIGHTPVSKTEIVPPLCKHTIWNLDTGAAFKGVLTILNIDSKVYWQSDPLPSLYPAEEGRNF